MRVVNHEFAGLMAKALGAGDAWGNYLPNWFATRNFHGQWYADSDRLEELVPFRSETMKDFVSQTSATVPSYVRLFSKWLPGAGRKRMERLARGPGGTLNWIESDDRAHINAYFGSREAWEALPSSWAEFEPRQPSRDMSLLHHGYDTEKPAENWSRTELEEAAEFRGAQFLSDSAPEPDLPISWQCALGHQFSITPDCC